MMMTSTVVSLPLTSGSRRPDVTLKLTQLQNLCKRDPAAHLPDYCQQVRRLESELAILSLQPATEPSPRLVELIQFAAAVSSSSYRGVESNRIATLLIRLLSGSTRISTTTSRSSDSNNNNNNNNTLYNAESNNADAGDTASVAAMVSIMPAAAMQLHRDVRKAAVSALMMMRHKGTVPALVLLQLFFRLMAVVPDKILREILYKHMVQDIRNLNKKGKKKQDVVNRNVQSFLHRVVCTHGTTTSGTAATSNNEEESATDVAAKRATDLVAELYRRRVWTDDRTIAILASAIQSSNTTVMARAMRFFLQIEETMAADDAAIPEEEYANKKRVDYHAHSKKTASRTRHVERQIKNRKRAQHQKEKILDWADMDRHPERDKGVEVSKKLYPAMELLRDPQGLAEHVLKRLRGTGSIKYSTKLLMINFVTRLVGNHELLLLPLYPFLQKYMGGHQKDVTCILAYTVQACHEQVPPDEIYGILKTIAHNFITERCSEEQMAVGINAARAICSRVPSTLVTEHENHQNHNVCGTDGGDRTDATNNTSGCVDMDMEAFARDLAAFSTHRDRSVSTAAKAWTNFVRETHPALLQGKDRGLHGSALARAGTKPLRFGECRIATGVEGADLLLEYEAKKAVYLARKKYLLSTSDDNDDNDDADDASDDESDGWEDVSHDDDNEEVYRDADAEIDEGEHEDWEEVSEGELDEDDNDDEEEEQEGEDTDFEANKNVDNDDDSEAPELIVLGNGHDVAAKQSSSSSNLADLQACIPDLTKMTTQEREHLKQQVSASRIFSTADFEKMRKLVEREQKARRDPREAARRKRVMARRGQDFEQLSGDEGSDDSSDSSDEEQRIRIPGAVHPDDIMALSRKKRQNKAQRLAKVLAGRTAFEAKQREGGATNVEKKRTKNFQMSKHSRDALSKNQQKGRGKRKRHVVLKHEAKKRRRKL